MFLFLPITLLGYFLLNKKKYVMASKVWLIFASLFFYTYWNVRYLPLLLGSIFFNYALGTTLEKTFLMDKKKKAVLFFGISCNVLLLGYYKYFNFFIANINIILPVKLNFLNLILPLGISFFTFTQIAFLVDCYKGKAKEYDFLNYILFVTFFPHLIAGPIIHHKEMMPQFNVLRNKIFNWKNVAQGLFLFSLGIFKKVIIADRLSLIANGGFDGAIPLKVIDAWTTSLSYTFQLYFDFSGYTDMALGLSLLFNIKLPINFNSPYKALNIQDFWKRWHMTLSRFLRDYIYIPLGGNRNGRAATLRNILITFFICGLWHGDDWTFIFWGLLNGLAIIIHRAWELTGIKMNKILAWLITFNFINFSWIFFRARTWGDATRVIRGMLGLNGFTINGLSLVLLISLLVSFLCRNSNELVKDFTPKWQTALISAVLFAISILNMNKISEFIYFNF